MKSRVTILLVEDEAIVRKSIAMLLKHSGHDVILAEDGEAALMELAQRPFDLVITDFSMPGMHGDELVRRIRERWPGQRIIMSTAFAEEYQIFGQANRGVDALLLKPFTHQELVDAIELVFAEEKPSFPIDLPPDSLGPQLRDQ